MLIATTWSRLVAARDGTTNRVGINMRHETSTSNDRKSRLRLRVGVLLILLWLIPFWALAPYIAHSLRGQSNPPSVEAVTAAIVVLQTLIGLLGSWVAGTEVKSIIRGSTTKHALGAIWSIFIHGEVQRHDDVSADLHEGESRPEGA
jgi:hypothetical protein